MIVIIAYSQSDAEQIIRTVDLPESEIKISSSEVDLVKADKIILPNASNFNSAYRKMQFCNLFSLLRIINKPILGINTGFHLMCNRIIGMGKIGLGFFNLNINLSLYDQKKFNHVTGLVKIIGNSKLVKLENEGSMVEVDVEVHREITSFTKSKFIINNDEYSLTYEFGNWYGVELSFEKNPILSKKIIDNFLSI